MKYVQKWLRTTIFLSTALKRNLDLLSIMRKEPKAEIIRRALSEYLKKEGLEPDQDPQIQICYDKKE
jgi:predicted transcriptional regulator